MWLSVRKGIQFVISTLPQLVPRAKAHVQPWLLLGVCPLGFPQTCVAPLKLIFDTQYCQATGPRDLSSIDLVLPGALVDIM